MQAYAVKPYQIPSRSMEPTLDVGQRILVNRFSHRLGADPEIGDVVVFIRRPAPLEGGRCGVEPRPGEPCPEPDDEMAEENYIKRVVAGPNDRLRIDEGIPIVNDRPLEATGKFAHVAGSAAAITRPRSPFHPITTS